MMHKAWSSIEEVPYCFSRSSVKFQGHTALKTVEFYPNWAFPDCNSSFNTPMVTKWCTKLEVEEKRCPIGFSRSYVKLQGHTALKIVEFDPNWAFPDCNSSLNSPMAMKCLVTIIARSLAVLVNGERQRASQALYGEILYIEIRSWLSTKYTNLHKWPTHFLWPMNAHSCYASH